MRSPASSVTEPQPGHTESTYQDVLQPPGDFIVPDINTQEVCTQLQIRYACGHSTGGEFVKCPRHVKKEDERCTSRQINHVDVKNSSHKCRLCLRSE